MADHPIIRQQKIVSDVLPHPVHAVSYTYVHIQKQLHDVFLSLILCAAFFEFVEFDGRKKDKRILPPLKSLSPVRVVCLLLPPMFVAR